LILSVLYLFPTLVFGQCEYGGVDFSELGVSGDYIGAQASPSYLYKFNICRAVIAPPTGSGCQPGSAVYQTSSSNYCYVAITTPNSPTFADLPDLPTGPQKGAQMTYADSDRFCSSVPSKVIIDMVCDETKPRIPPAGGSYVTVEPTPCTYTITFPSALACEVKAGGGGGGGGSDGGGGLSGGSIFLIVFFVGGFAYLAGGFAYKNKTEGASGLEAIPNIAFWRELPALVKDGFTFTIGKIRGTGGGGGGSSYSTVG